MGKFYSGKLAGCLVVILLVLFFAKTHIVESVHAVSIDVSREEAMEDPHICALFVADRIKDNYYKPWMLSEVALTFIDIGQEEKVGGILTKALVIARTLDDESFKADALLEVASGYAEIGQYEKALKIASTIKATIPRVKTFTGIARKYAQDGFKDKAKQVLFVASIGIGVIKDKTADAALAEITATYAGIGAFGEALSILEEIRDDPSRVKAMAELAAEYLRSGEKNKALRLLSRAEKTASSMKDKVNKANAYSLVATQYTNAGEKEKAIELLDGAYQISGGIKSKYTKPEVLLNISAGYAEVGAKEKALDVAEDIDDNDYGPRTLAKVAVKFAEEGKKDKAYKILSQALKMTKPIRSATTQANVMLDIADTYIKIGDNDNALKVAEKMKDNYNKPRALSAIAVKYAGAGEKGKAAQVFVQALEVARTIEDNFYKSWALAEIADKYAEAGLKADERAKKVMKEIVQETVEK